MRISFHQFHQNGVNAITDQQSALSHTQLQLATQKRILSPSEDPVASTLIEAYKTDIDVLSRYKINTESVQSSNELEDGLIEQVTNAMQRVRELFVAAGNGALSAQDRAALANEASERLEEIIGVANTKNSQGEYMFSGFKTSVKPFVRDAVGTVQYFGDQGQRLLNTSGSIALAISDSGYELFENIPNGNGDFSVAANAANTGTGVLAPGSVSDRAAYVRDTYTFSFSLNVSGQLQFSVNGVTSGAVITNQLYTEDTAITFNGITTQFDGVPAVGDTFTVSPSVSQDVFTTIQGGINAMRMAATTSAQKALMREALDQAMESLDQASIKIDTIRSQIGTRLNIAQTELESNLAFSTQLKTSLSGLADLDNVEAISRLKAQETALDAAQQSYAQVQGLTLFRYIR